MTPGPLQLAIIAILVLILFGRGKISEMMGDFGKGIKSFKKGMHDDDADAPSKRIEHEAKPAGEGLGEDQTKTTDENK